MITGKCSVTSFQSPPGEGVSEADLQKDKRLASWRVVDAMTCDAGFATTAAKICSHVARFSLSPGERAGVRASLESLLRPLCSLKHEQPLNATDNGPRTTDD